MISHVARPPLKAGVAREISGQEIRMVDLEFSNDIVWFVLLMESKDKNPPRNTMLK